MPILANLTVGFQEAADEISPDRHVWSAVPTANAVTSMIQHRYTLGERRPDP
jgi:hypothetical protein